MDLILKKHKILRIKEQNECLLEKQRLQEICRMISDDNNNREIDSRDSSPDDQNGGSSETINGLTIEEELIKAEIRHLSENPESDDDDEDLKEFQKIERELRVQELNKCLHLIQTQISNCQLKAPLAEIESFCTEEEDIREEETSFQSQRGRQTRPLTLYLPVLEEMDLKQHIQTLGHELEDKIRDIFVNKYQSFGYLWKKCQKSENNWRKRFFIFDRKSKTFIYFHSKRQFERQQQPRGGVPFDAINDVYVDHSRIKSEDNCRQVFVVSTTCRQFVLSTFKAEVMRIWVDVIVTGAQGCHLNFDF